MRKLEPPRQKTIALGQALALSLGITGAGCASSLQPITPILTVPEAPPRVVAMFPPEPDPVPEEDASAEPGPVDEDTDDGIEAEDLTTRAPEPDPPVAPPEAPVETPDETDDTDQVERQLVSLPDQELDEQAVGETLDGADQLLGGFERASLNSAGRAQYDTARRFLQQARTALDAENYVYAFFLGEKARALAEGL